MPPEKFVNQSKKYYKMGYEDCKKHVLSDLQFLIDQHNLGNLVFFDPKLAAEQMGTDSE